MPIYEYICPQCRNTFELRRSFSECDAEAKCPTCDVKADRIISSFSTNLATPRDSFLRTQDSAKEKMWMAQRRAEDDKIKDPDPLARWRKEREQACGRGPEAWVEWAKEEMTKQEKEKDDQRTKEQAEKDYANWAMKSTKASEYEREMYKLKKEEKEYYENKEQEFKAPRLDETVVEPEKPAFDYPPVWTPAPKSDQPKSWERKRKVKTEAEDEEEAAT
jgi:putative FmdB family regulatory protein